MSLSLALDILIMTSMAGFLIMLRRALPDYLKEKRVHLATKQDVRDLKEKLEALKGQVKQVATEGPASGGGEMAQEREALVQFFENCQNLLFAHDAFEQGDEERPDGQYSLKVYQQDLEKSCLQIVSDYHRMLIYFTAGDGAMEAAGQVAHAASTLHKASRKAYLGVTSAVRDVKPNGSPKSYGHANGVGLAISAVKNYHRTVDEHMDDVYQAFETYLQAIHSHYAKLGQRSVMEALLLMRD